MQSDDRYRRKHSVRPEVHVLNKAEAKTLRRLMAKTGLVEKELRQHKKYRKELSEAQKAGANPINRTPEEKLEIKVMRRLLKDPKSPCCGLAKEHPLVQKEFKARMRLLEQMGQNSLSRWRYI
ncbi:hypothetical protein E4H12_12890 [Candidatus Thorarchaeota archaeon]|nr:MAG: hypothetical protein E4H12_12890 [Candidatus Thorarchaeota archaeon]